MVNKTFSALTRRWIALWALVCSVVALPSAALALEPVIVDESTTEIKLGKHLEYLEDPSGTLTLEDVLKPEVAARFVKSEVDSPGATARARRRRYVGHGAVSLEGMYFIWT